MNPLTWARTALAVVLEVLDLVVREPIRTGRLRTAGWPEGLGAIVALAGVGFATAAALVLGAPLARTHGEIAVGLSGGLVFPRWTLPVLLLLVVLTISLLHAASLHLAPWIRVATLLVVILAVLSSVFQTPQDEGVAPNVVTFVGCGLLALLTALRWRGEFRWWEFVVSLLLVGGTIGLALRLTARTAQALGFDTGPTTLVLAMQLVAGLSVPFTFVAGLAFAQLATLLAHRVGDVVEERVRSSLAVGALVAVVAAADLALVVRHLTRPTDSGNGHLHEWAAAGVLLVLVLGATLPVVLRGRALDGLEDAVSGIAIPTALLVTVVSIPALVLSRVGTQAQRLFSLDHVVLADVTDALTTNTAFIVTRVFAGLALLGWGLWQRHRRPVPALLAVAVGLTVLVSYARRATGDLVDLPWTDEALTDLAAVLAVAVLLGLLATRRLTRRRLLALGVALGLSLAYSVRSTFDAPFVALFGLGATAAVFLGVVWATLTDADDANGDSPRWPRPARVLLFLGNALLAMTTMAFLALASTTELGIDTSAFATLGDDYLGTGLLLAAYAVVAREVATRSPR